MRRVSSRRAAVRPLAAGTAFAALALASYFVPTAPAFAACVADTSGAPSPDSLDCTGVDTDGITANSTDGNGIAVVIQPGAIVTNGGGGQGVDININQTGVLDFDLTKPLTFDMSASNTSIVTQGNAIDINRGGLLSSLTGTVTIGGNVQSTLNNGMVFTTTAGTGGGSLDINVTDTGAVEGFNNGIVYNSVSGVSNVNITNDGDIFGGNSAIVLNAGVGNLGGTMTVINNGQIGNAGHAGTGPRSA